MSTLFQKHWRFASLFTALTAFSLTLLFLRDHERDVLGAVLAKNLEIADLKAELARFSESAPPGIPSEVFPHEGDDPNLLYPRASEVVSFNDLPMRVGDDSYYSVILIRHADGSEVRVVVKSASSLVTEWLKNKLSWR